MNFDEIMHKYVNSKSRCKNADFRKLYLSELKKKGVRTMKLSDKGFSIEAGEYFRGCQDMPEFPDAPFAAAEFFAGKNTVKIIPARLAPIEATIFYNVSGGADVYEKLSAFEFFYIIVLIDGNIEGAHVPDEIFPNATDAEAFALLHQIDYAALR